MADMNAIRRVELQLPNPNDHSKLAFILLNVFTPEECQQWIDLSEKRGYAPALINMGFGQVLLPDVRNNQRCMIDDSTMAGMIFDRIKSSLPQKWQNRSLVELNERLRFLRYDPGEKFEAHLDGHFRRSTPPFDTSFLTIQLYLNEGFEGGETTFLHPSDPFQNVRCVPQTGMVLVFQHDILHEGSELRKGRKYTVRTDVMYRSA